MTAPGLLIPVDQHVAAAVQKQNLILFLFLPQGVQSFKEAAEHIAASGIGDNSYPLHLRLRLLAQGIKYRNQLGRNIIHTVKADIL